MGREQLIETLVLNNVDWLPGSILDPPRKSRSEGFGAVDLLLLTVSGPYESC